MATTLSILHHTEITVKYNKGRRLDWLLNCFCFCFCFTGRGIGEGGRKTKNQKREEAAGGHSTKLICFYVTSPHLSSTVWTLILSCLPCPHAPIKTHKRKLLYIDNNHIWFFLVPIIVSPVSSCSVLLPNKGKKTSLASHPRILKFTSTQIQFYISNY